MGKSRQVPKICVMCRIDVNDEIKFGKLYKLKNVWVHYYCLLLSETITQSGEDEEGILGFLHSDITKEVGRSKSKKCCYCNKMNASLGCVHRHCNRKFHMYCGYLNNAMFHFTKFTTHCNLHTKPSNLPASIKKSLKDYYCLICLDDFHEKTKPSQVYWASCCKSRVLLHIDCLRQMALNAGYFTKCPGCNNNTDFIESIRMWGVFVPEQDASWELDRNAFSDLLYVHDTCDSLKCLCPDGRNFSTDKGKWKLILCKTCGSVGTHVGCTEFKRRFLCDVCTLSGEENTTIDDPPQPEQTNEDEFIDIEILDRDYFTDCEDNNSSFQDDCENVEPLPNPNRTEEKKTTNPERGVSEQNVRKRSFQDITNSGDQEVNVSFAKKFKDNNVSHEEIEHLTTIEENSLSLLQHTETLEPETEITAQQIPLDDDSEVEFVSYTQVVDSSPKIPLHANSVELFLNSVISKPPCLQKRNFLKICESPHKVKRNRKSKLNRSLNQIKNEKKSVQLSLENFITRTKV
ncbi:hypothetical protein PPYR_04908 [Photinus pyralis]|uniref:PHD-type domain-containing protein n=1 Tax=Photinus pyralis TaxID=7054 RepID=A0A1Y1LYR4_PHOPY|nr:uncharacterized protein LOC116163082 [Photinus pyralis]XP_031334016.1 uncharacterized protein LOC116164029 [Photinus pyralis]KAB0802719.1 hypothetical protein PPYR_04905 [Photinus pyralis]KAB0802722.1 hypothetical protein PPYR_04908 [Photinus pyralis]